MGIAFLVFIGISIVIYTNMPSSESALPQKNITEHELHSTITDVISPQFNVDASIINTIPQINPLQTFSTNTNKIDSNSKNAVVYALSGTSTKNSFCSLLLSISSAISSTTSS